MTSEQTEQLVLVDKDGNYYLFSREMLEQARVPAEHSATIRAELEKVVAESDVAGFSAIVSTLAVGEEADTTRPLPTFTTLATHETGDTFIEPIRLPFLPPFFR